MIGDHSRLKPGEFVHYDDPDLVIDDLYVPANQSPRTHEEATWFLAFWKGTAKWNYTPEADNWESSVTVTMERYEKRKNPIEATAPTFLLAVRAVAMIVLEIEQEEEK